MPVTRILIASVLKPVYEPRMYEKIGITLSQLPEVEVHITGYGKEETQHQNKVYTHGLGTFKRLSFKRLLAPWKVLLQLQKLKPAIAIACTHEVLIPFFIYKLIHPSTRLVYDLQENYYLNILHTRAFPLFLRLPLACYVRVKERLVLPFISLVMAAEQCYLREMPFIRSKAIVIANKARTDKGLKRINTPANERVCLLYTGTISTEYGIYKAIELVEQLHRIDPSFYLQIAGYCANTAEARKLKTYLLDKPFVEALPFDEPLPHDAILEAISKAHWGLICYLPNKATEHRIPTKLYEYLSSHLPVLSTHNATWQHLIETHHAGFCIDFKHTDIPTLIPLLKNGNFYSTLHDTSDFSWESEVPKLLKALGQ